METLSHTRVTADEREPERWLLVLHGIYGSGRNWHTLIRNLVDERPQWGGVLVDLRLHGGSTGFAPPHTIAAAAADVDRLVEELDLHAAAVLGHSFGGKVALTYAGRHAEELRQVWVIDSTLETREPSGSAWRIIDRVRSLPDEFASREELVEAMERQGYPRPLGNWLAMNLERRGERFVWRLDWDGVEAMLRDYFRTDVWDVVESPPSEIEVHVVKGTRSDSIDQAAAERVRAAERTGRTSLHLVEGGHWLNTENPDALLRLLAERLP